MIGSLCLTVCPLKGAVPQQRLRSFPWLRLVAARPPADLFYQDFLAEIHTRLCCPGQKQSLATDPEVAIRWRVRRPSSGTMRAESTDRSGRRKDADFSDEAAAEEEREEELE